MYLGSHMHTHTYTIQHNRSVARFGISKLTATLHSGVVSRLTVLFFIHIEKMRKILKIALRQSCDPKLGNILRTCRQIVHFSLPEPNSGAGSSESILFYLTLVKIGIFMML